MGSRAHELTKLAAGFFAWHFMLRRMGIRLATRRSARLYAALGLGCLAQRHASAALAMLSFASLWWGAARGRSAQSHFDVLAPDYAEQLSPTARDRVVNRKTALM